jgi:hypothetical protein
LHRSYENDLIPLGQVLVRRKDGLMQDKKLENEEEMNDKWLIILMIAVLFLLGVLVYFALAQDRANMIERTQQNIMEALP